MVNIQRLRATLLEVTRIAGMERDLIAYKEHSGLMLSSSISSYFDN